MTILSIYIPYGVEVIVGNTGMGGKLYGVGGEKSKLISPDDAKSNHWVDDDVYPILYPIDCIYKQIQVLKSTICPINELICMMHDSEVDTQLTNHVIMSDESIIANYEYGYKLYGSLEIDIENILNNPYWIVQSLLSWHIDVFGLIKQKQAIKKDII